MIMRSPCCHLALALVLTSGLNAAKARATLVRPHMAAAPEVVRFAIFDWLDESGRDQGETYAERLRMLELADRAGFYAYHLAEHHATELSTVPSPNLFLAAVAQRTGRLRLGPLT